MVFKSQIVLNRQQTLHKSIPSQDLKKFGSLQTHLTSNVLVPHNKKYHYSCKGLFAHGTLVPKCQLNDSLNEEDCAKNVAERWRVDGCKLRYYSRADITKCFRILRKKYSTINFFGDSTVKGTYLGLVHKLSDGLKDYVEGKIKYLDKESHVYVTYQSNKFMDSSVPKILEGFLTQTPILFYTGSVLHDIQIQSNEGIFNAVKGYRKIFDELLPIVKKLAEKSKNFVWTLQHPVLEDAQIFEKRVEHRNVKIDMYNVATEKILENNNSNITLLYSIRDVGKQMLTSYQDETHMGAESYAIVVEILLNYICNNQWQDTNVQDNDEEICCSQQSRDD